VRIEGFVTPSELVQLYRQQFKSAQTVATR
jgi:hypothetical protein